MTCSYMDNIKYNQKCVLMNIQYSNVLEVKSNSQKQYRIVAIYTHIRVKEEKKRKSNEQRILYV